MMRNGFEGLGVGKSYSEAGGAGGEGDIRDPWGGFAEIPEYQEGGLGAEGFDTGGYGDMPWNGEGWDNAIGDADHNKMPCWQALADAFLHQKLANQHMQNVADMLGGGMPGGMVDLDGVMFWAKVGAGAVYLGDPSVITGAVYAELQFAYFQMNQARSAMSAAFANCF